MSPQIDFPGAIAAWVPNYAARKPGYKIDLIVLHATAGKQSQEEQVSGTLAWFANPASQVSSHYLIGLGGEVYQCVSETLCAWHGNGPGLPDYNDHSIGIELAQQAGKSDYTNPQLGALINVLIWLVRRYDIKRTAIITHASINPGKSDPLGWAAYNKKVLDGVYDSASNKPAEPAPDPDMFRKAAYDAMQIPYNPGAAFVLYARLHGLGPANGPEFSFTYTDGTHQYSGQGFVNGIAYCKTGDWANIKTLNW